LLMDTTSPLTLTHFILNDQQSHPQATGDFSILLHAFEIASKYVSSKVRAAGLFNLYGFEGSTNATGDAVKKLDILANEAFITSLKRCKKVSIMASEENEEPIVVEDSAGHYVAVFDPLDGSSNIDVNISIGTIFGIYRKLDTSSTAASVKDILQPGTQLVAAGYTMYGSATQLVYTSGHGVQGFTLDPSTGEFVLTHPNIRVKEHHPIYSVNEGNSLYWFEPTKKYVESVKNPTTGKPYSQRYVGSMVADVHRTLIYGGIFMYPGDKNAKDGKLRLVYEANPMAMIMEQAGGKASTGTGRILEVIPTTVHQKTAVFMGSAKCVDAVESFHKAAN